ncbi:MAG: glycosyltransferase [Gammaproteobacteria bacterium]|nr:glycosyltransferase [Gammaproteobacteria bacterium]
MPTVSICVPTYNRKNYLKETLNSIFAQTYNDYEVIVVDDGSTDGTKEMISKLNLPIRYFWKKNEGDAATRNKLIELAIGKYISFIDSDDLLYPDSIERLVASIKPYGESAIGYGGYVQIDAEGQEIKTKQKKLPSGFITAPLFQEILVHSCGSIFPRKVLTERGGFNTTLKVCSDYEAWLDLSMKYIFIAQAYPTFKRRRHNNNLSKPTFENMKLEHDVLWEFYFNRGGNLIIAPKIAALRLAKRKYRIAMAAWHERMNPQIIEKYLWQSIKMKFTLKAVLKLLGLKTLLLVGWVK